MRAISSRRRAASGARTATPEPAWARTGAAETSGSSTAATGLRPARFRKSSAVLTAMRYSQVENELWRWNVSRRR